MFELLEARIPATLVPDAAAPGLIARGEVAAGVGGADRKAGNGDIANKVGTLALALAARRFDVPFYVVAPVSTLDGEIPEGARIPIEERSEDEVLGPLRPDRVPAGARARNPAFDLTPGDLVSALVTERGVARPPLAAAIKAWLPNGR
jgi:methylthioribose-1-phosphate isomerase